MPRNLSIDLLRIIACLGVVMIHTAGSPICHGWLSPGESGYNVCLTLHALSRFVPQALPLCLGGALAAFVLGWGLTFLIRKIPYLGKYIV